jgi:hypothetical protein
VGHGRGLAGIFGFRNPDPAVIPGSSAGGFLDTIDRMLNASGLAARDPICFIGIKTRVAALLVQAASGRDVGRAVAALAPEVARHLGADDAASLRELLGETTGLDAAVIPFRPSGGKL